MARDVEHTAICSHGRAVRALALCAFGVALAGCSRKTTVGQTPNDIAATASRRDAILVFPSAVVDLGRIAQAGAVDGHASLLNQTDDDILLADPRTSCDCLSVTLSSSVVAPHEKVDAPLHLDLSEDPVFTGRLLIDVELLDEAGRDVGRFAVAIDVTRNGIAAPD